MTASRTPRRIAAVLAGLGLAVALAPASPPARGGPSAQGPVLDGYRHVADWTTRSVGGRVDWGQPAGLDVAPDDAIWVADGGADAVVRLDAGGALLGTWSAVRPAGASPADVAFAPDPATGGRVFVLSRSGVEIRSAADGAVVGGWSQAGLTGIAVGADRRVYVARNATGPLGAEAAIDVHDIGGNRLATWQDAGFFVSDPRGLDVGADGTVFLASGDGAVYAWRDGGVKALLQVRRDVEGGPLVDVAADGQGRVFALQRTQGRDPRLAGWNVTAADWSAGGRGMVYIEDVTARGALWLAVGPGAGLVMSLVDGAYRGIGHLADRGDLGGVIARWGSGDETLGQLDAPIRVAVSEAGDVFIGDRLERVQRWAADGTPRQQWPAPQIGDVAGGAPMPCYLSDVAAACLDAAGTRWQVDAPEEGWFGAVDGAGGQVAVVDVGRQIVLLYDAAGAPVGAGSWPFAAPGSFALVSDVALDGGRVYLADRTSRVVSIHSAAGVLTGEVDVPGGAVRVAARAGELYAISRDGWLWKYDAGGTLRAAFRPAPDGRAADLAVGPDGTVYVADPENDRIRLFAPGGPPPSGVPDAVEGSCRIDVDKRAGPESVEQGGEVTVILDIGGRCPEGDGRIDVALVLDRSGSMLGAPIAAARRAAVAFLGELAPGAAQVALVGFSTSEEVLQPLTGDFQLVVRGVRRLIANGQTNYAPALEAGRLELEGPAARDDVNHVLVMMTDGSPTDRSSATRAADEVKRAGITLYTVGLGSDLDRDLLQRMASSENDVPLYFDVASELDLADVYADIGRRIAATKLLEQGTVVDILPADMSYVAGSAFPPAIWDPLARSLTWRLADVPATGERLSYRVRATQPGIRPTNVQATLDYRDIAGAAGTKTFPVPLVNVRARTRWDAYFPYAARSFCRPQRADVVLVFDTSSSMNAAAGGGVAGSKMDAAIAAGRTFTQLMQLPDDQVAIVTFDASARTVQQLTGARAVVEAALRSIATGNGTRIDLGIDRAFAELLSARHRPSNAPVMIVLTDGLPTAGTEAAALRSARFARAAGFQVYSIGLGADADPFLLSEIAGAPGRSFMAPEASRLRAIYEQIAGAVLCE